MAKFIISIPMQIVVLQLCYATNLYMDLLHNVIDKFMDVRGCAQHGLLTQHAVSARTTVSAHTTLFAHTTLSAHTTVSSHTTVKVIFTQVTTCSMILL